MRTSATAHLDFASDWNTSTRTEIRLHDKLTDASYEAKFDLKVTPSPNLRLGCIAGFAISALRQHSQRLGNELLQGQSTQEKEKSASGAFIRKNDARADERSKSPRNANQQRGERGGKSA